MAESVVISAPDGRRYRVSVPEGKTPEDARLWFKEQHGAGKVDPSTAISQVPTKEDKASAWEEFKAGFGRADTDIQNLTLWFESKFPVLHPDDKWYRQMSSEERREFLHSNREASEEREFGDAGKEGAAAFTGNVAGSLMSPTTLAPMGNSLKAAAVIGGGLGLGFSAAEDLAAEGTIDPLKAAGFTAGGAIAAPATLAAGRALGKLAEKGIEKFRANTKSISDTAVKAPTSSVEPRSPEVGGVGQVEDSAAQKGIQDPLAEFATPEEIQGDINRREFFGKGEGDPIPQDSGGTPMPTVKERGQVTKVIDDFIGNISTRVKDISEPVFGKLRKFEFNSHVTAYDTKRKVEPFLKSMKGLSKDGQTNMTRYLYNGQFDEAKALMAKESPGMEKEFEAVQETLANLYMDLKDAGYDSLGFIENYYPRYVKDVPGLLESLGKKERSLVELALDKKAKALGKVDKSRLTSDEETQVINSVLRGYAPKETGGRLGFTKTRSIDELTDEQLKFYSTPVESIDAYIGRAINDIEKRKFFGKGGVVEDGRINLSESIGNLVAEERKAGNLSDGQIVELADLLQARFGPGETAPNVVWGTLRDVTNMTTIANPASAVTQLGDVGVATYMNGMRNTFAAMFGKNALDMKELGLLQELAEELTSKQSTAQALQEMFKLSGFRSMDRFGKNVLIGGAHRKWSKLVKTDKGQARLRAKYGTVFGDSFDGLVGDLKAGRMSENVKFMLWNELSDAQPISLSEVPKKYLESPNGRIFYALKTFMLKQLDILRRDIIGQYKKGNKAQALGNAVKYTALVGGSNTAIDEVKDLMLGGDFNPEAISTDKIVLNALKNFGGSEYAFNRSLKEGKLFDYGANQALPALGWINAIGQDIVNIADPESETTFKSLKHAPIIGKLMYYWFTEEGQEKMLEKELDDAGFND